MNSHDISLQSQSLNHPNDFGCLKSNWAIEARIAAKCILWGKACTSLSSQKQGDVKISNFNILQYISNMSITLSTSLISFDQSQRPGADVGFPTPSHVAVLAEGPSPHFGWTWFATRRWQSLLQTSMAKSEVLRGQQRTWRCLPWNTISHFLNSLLSWILPWGMVGICLNPGQLWISHNCRLFNRSSLRLFCTKAQVCSLHHSYASKALFKGCEVWMCHAWMFQS